MPRARSEIVEKAARAFKRDKLEGYAKAYGDDVMDDVAIALNARPTRQEEAEAEYWLARFEALGCVVIPEDDNDDFEVAIKECGILPKGRNLARHVWAASKYIFAHAEQAPGEDPMRIVDYVKVVMSSWGAKIHREQRARGHRV